MERRSLAIRGTVQGVGFRPFVYSLALRFALRGFVRNAPEGVLIEVEGDSGSLDAFAQALKSAPPQFTHIEEWQEATVPVEGAKAFRIEPSAVTCRGQTPRVTADIATCAACFAELQDPRNRRFGYPFITCSQCGPRLTLVTGVPYDRERTTMASFRLCGACHREYEDPADRRFHAQTIACWDCGPRLTCVDAGGVLVRGAPLDAAVGLLKTGGIVAVKGLGGYQLACDATSAPAVRRLRERKHREAQPFAVMFETFDAVQRVCEVNAVERQLLEGAVRPIVLLTRRADRGGSALAEEVAPGIALVGAMLPTTPLHQLLLRAAGGPLVMTSGNRSGAPTIAGDATALDELGAVADAFLVHDRAIHVRCDDSVTRVAGGRELPVRRSRGHAPQPLSLPWSAPATMLAVGAQLKNTFAFGLERAATISHHIGDLDNLSAYREFTRDIALYERVLGATPRMLVHDSHPEYASTRYAIERAARDGLAALAVQHHHAHIAGCLAEHGVTEAAIGVAFDGTGFGEDGTIWGGEFLIGDIAVVRRAARLRAVAMPGGDQAIRQPWRMALAYLTDAGLDAGPIRARVGATQWGVVTRMIERRLNAPLTSSAGRLFDAVACIAGVRDVASFEGQAAMELETLATQAAPDGTYDATLEDAGDCLVIDTRPIVRAVWRDRAAGVAPPRIARRFHAGLVTIVTSVAVALRARTGLTTVALSGGVFQNALLTVDCERQLTEAGFRVLRHRLVPPGDGGISFGQLAVAAARSQPCA